MNDIQKVRHVRDYILWVEFDDGTSGSVDLSAYLSRGPIFSPLADPEFFKPSTVEPNKSK